MEASPPLTEDSIRRIVSSSLQAHFRTQAPPSTSIVNQVLRGLPSPVAPPMSNPLPSPTGPAPPPQTKSNMADLVRSLVCTNTEPLANRMLTVESNVADMKAELSKLTEIIKQQSSGAQLKKRKRIKEPEAENSTDKEGEAIKKRTPHPLGRLACMPRDVLSFILCHISISDCIKSKVYLTCKIFYDILLSDMRWKCLFEHIFKIDGDLKFPWMRLTTDNVQGIRSLNDKPRTGKFCEGFNRDSWMQKYKRMIEIRERNSIMSRIRDGYQQFSWIKACNLIPCVIIDPELGMVNHAAPRTRYSKRVFNGSKRILGKKPVTVLYVIINRTKEHKLFEAKVVFVDKKTEQPATKKTHRNDVFEGIMQMILKCYESNAFHLPYWDPMITKEKIRAANDDSSDSDEEDNEDEDLKTKPLEVIVKHNLEMLKRQGSSKSFNPLVRNYTNRPYSNVLPIEHSANDSGYVIITPGTFTLSHAPAMNEAYEEAYNFYFRPNSLWFNTYDPNNKKKDSTWHGSTTRYICSYKCAIEFEALQDPIKFMRAIMSPNQRSITPLPLDIEELTLDLQIMYSLIPKTLVPPK